MEAKFKGNEKVKVAYNALFAYNEKKYENGSFSNCVMAGYMRKLVSGNKIFCRNRYPKRYFTINFRSG